MPFFRALLVPVIAAGLLNLAGAQAASAQTPLTGATSVSVGDLHACAVVNGGVKCWGNNIVGQLGDGTEIDRPIAVDVVGLPAGSNVTAVAAGVEHTCAIANGDVLCWGRNNEGQLGIGMSGLHMPTPMPGAGLSGVTSITAGQFFTCAVSGGGVWCWGDNSQAVGAPSASPEVIVPLGSGATMVSAGYDHACAVVDGGVQCWGFGDWGQLGDGNSTSSALPVSAIAAGSGATTVSAGYDHSCAMVAGQLQCWGVNGTGQLGNGEMGVGLRSAIPVDVVGFAGMPAAVTAGAGHSCASAEGGVQCWGMNLFGVLGIGSFNPDDHSSVPVGVVNLAPGSGTTNLSAGLYVTCAVVNGGVQCWGYGFGGELGSGELASSAVPVAVIVDDPVVNTAPSLGPITISPSAVVSVGTGITAAALFSDPDFGDTHACGIAWGDGTSSQPAPVGASCVAPHTYATPGVYLVTMAVTDAAGASDSGVYAYVVVYDPAAGFVTGGGWFDSAPGAYRPDPTLAGRAQFGFVAKHQKGRTMPDGHTEFQFKGAGLAFRSAAYDWLVIAGSKAMFTGRGTINGGGDYGFQLTAIDGQATGSGVDRVRVKIWDRATGETVYDNQTCGSQADDADACTVLGGGEIVIHATKK